MLLESQYSNQDVPGQGITIVRNGPICDIPDERKWSRDKSYLPEFPPKSRALIQPHHRCYFVTLQPICNPNPLIVAACTQDGETSNLLISN